MKYAAAEVPSVRQAPVGPAEGGAREPLRGPTNPRQRQLWHGASRDRHEGESGERATVRYSVLHLTKYRYHIKIIIFLF